jgi:hypothetical protein
MLRFLGGKTNSTTGGFRRLVLSITVWRRLMALLVALLFRGSLAENWYYWPSSPVGMMGRLHSNISRSMQMSG